MHTRWLLFTVVAALTGCASTHVTTPLVRAAVASSGSRHAIFESTLRTLDDHPEYVDEFVALARSHQRTLDRFNANYAPMLADPSIARLTADHLAQSPPGLRQVLVSTIDSSRDRPAARAAIAAAIRDRSDISASIIGNDPSASSAMAASTVRAAQEGPRARSYFLAGMRATSRPVADLVASDPHTARTVAAATADAYERRAVASVQRAIPGTQPGEGDRAKQRKH